MFLNGLTIVAASLPLGALAWGFVFSFIPSSFFLFLTAYLPTVYFDALDSDSGHETIGYIAQAFLGPKTSAFVKATLDSQYAGQLGEAATWADEVKYDKGWTWLVVTFSLSSLR